MKLFITAVAAIMVAGPALASSRQAALDKVSWEQIETQKAKYFVDAPSVRFLGTNGGTFYKRLLTVDGKTNACIAGDQIFGGTSKVCKKWSQEDSRGNSKCLNYEPTDLYAPISGTRTICVDWENDERQNNCQKWLDIDYTIDTNVKAAILDQPSMQDDDSGTGSSRQGFIGYKTRQLPACN